MAQANWICRKCHKEQKHEGPPPREGCSGVKCSGSPRGGADFHDWTEDASVLLECANVKAGGRKPATKTKRA